MTAPKTSKFLLDLMGRYVDLALADLPEPKPTRVIRTQPGSVATWDGAKEGQLWIRLQGLSPTPAATPARMNGADLCAVAEWVATFQIGIIRCAATMDSRGNPPSPEAITADGVEGIDDMASILRTLADARWTRSVMTWTPTGPEGGFHGGYWTFTVAMPNLLGQEEG